MMRSSGFASRLCGVLLLGALVSGCGDSTEAPGAAEPEATDPGPTAEPSTPDASPASTGTSGSDSEPAAGSSALPVLETQPTAEGPRPLLEWEPVEGAASYTLVVLGSDGTPYWAWSGAEASVHLGGFDDPDAVGPWVHEPMTWTVAALDGAGQPLALSDPAVLS